MRFRRILRFTMGILRNEDFAKISPGGGFTDSRFVGKISQNEDFANYAMPKSVQQLAFPYINISVVIFAKCRSIKIHSYFEDILGYFFFAFVNPKR